MEGAKDPFDEEKAVDEHKVGMSEGDESESDEDLDDNDRELCLGDKYTYTAEDVRSLPQIVKEMYSTEPSIMLCSHYVQVMLLVKHGH